MDTATTPNQPTKLTQARHFVVGAQLDESGLDALRLAWSLAAADDKLHLCYCAGIESAVPAKDEAQLESGKHALERWAAEKLLRTPALGRTTLHTMLGEPANALVQLAASLDAHMIIVGTHDKGVLSRMVQGSTMRELIEHAPCPVAIARPKDYSAVDASPSLEPGLTSEQVARTLGVSHTYSYHRAMPLALPQSTIGSGFPS